MHLKAAVDEIRRKEQFAFWRDEDRFDGNVSLYSRKKINHVIRRR